VGLEYGKLVGIPKPHTLNQERKSMTKFRTGLAMVAAVLVGGLVAVPAKAADLPGAMNVHDQAGLFTAEAKSKSEARFSDTKFDRGLHFTVDTYKEIPADRKGSYNPDRKDAFFAEWAKSAAKGDREKGPYVLICMNPGRVEVVVDTESRNRGFSSTNRDELRDIFLKPLKASGGKVNDETRKAYDDSLWDATN
jgi:uncharacterized protein